mmetsp:Transcript_17499/g.51592  ORF Transcript_17499/g.51592 Transcript_17499/m.51592 type:complete len:229 (-) Transcript_17499:135-821(-)
MRTQGSSYISPFESRDSVSALLSLSSDAPRPHRPGVRVVCPLCGAWPGAAAGGGRRWSGGAAAAAIGCARVVIGVRGIKFDTYRGTQAALGSGSASSGSAESQTLEGVTPHAQRRMECRNGTLTERSESVTAYSMSTRTTQATRPGELTGTLLMATSRWSQKTGEAACTKRQARPAISRSPTQRSCCSALAAAEEAHGGGGGSLRKHPRREEWRRRSTSGKFAASQLR